MRALTMAMIMILSASMAWSKPPLRDVAEIDGALLDVGLADEIRSECPDISARMFRAIRFVNGLKDKALAMGYTEAEIDAYRKSDREKARLRAKGDAWLAARGVTGPADYCRVGKEEISKGSRIGSLLREN